eukprot:m.51832 g.51832  ORF g.51832 m.51832 type:complete len:187 (-) comp21505_c0_seq1:50-610(-)
MDDGIVRDTSLIKLGKDSDAFSYGKHCYECRELDFLAITCKHCERVFCHAHGVNHESDLNCPVLEKLAANRVKMSTHHTSSTAQATLSTSTSKIPSSHAEHVAHSSMQSSAAIVAKSKKKRGPRCAMATCKQSLSLFSVDCHNCHAKFCPKHRHGLDHACIGSTTSNSSRGSYNSRLLKGFTISVH